MTAAAPVQSSRSRRIAISAGALAVLLGALDTYVVVTIMRDIMSDVGIAINKIQRSRRSSPATCSATSRRCRCWAGIGPVRPQVAASGQPGGFRAGIGDHRAVRRPDHVGHRPRHPGHCQWRAAARDAGARRRPVGRPQPGGGAWRDRRRAGAGQRARPDVWHRAGMAVHTTGRPCSGSTSRSRCSRW